MSAAIDYVADAEKRIGKPGTRGMAVPERIDLDNAIIAGERSAAQIAAEFGLHHRTVERRRNELRKQGVRVRAPLPEDSDEFMDGVKRGWARGRTGHG